jgi:ABC-2 type transport system ATP-binding protein
LIDAEGLTKRFGDLVAVEGLTLHIGEGEVFGLLGPNGAGKTTTVRMLASLLTATSGSAMVDGHDVREEPQAVRRIVGLLPENVGLYGTLTVEENLDFFGRLNGLPPDRRGAAIRDLLGRFGLWDRRGEPAGNLSKGLKQRLALARAMVHDPKVLLLDEPTANLDPEAARMVRETILGLKGEGRTVLLNTHLLDEAQRVCDRVGVLRTRLVAVGSPADLRGRLGRGRAVVRLASVGPAIIEAAKRIGAVEPRGDSLLVEVADPGADVPRLVAAIVAAGGQVRSVGEEGPSLEDAYLALVRGG